MPTRTAVQTLEIGTRIEVVPSGSASYAKHPKRLWRKAYRMEAHETPELIRKDIGVGTVMIV